MAQVFRLEDFGKKRRTQGRTQPLFFSKSELSLLLSLYSRRVMRGDWRDYAIDSRPDTVIFSIYRNSHERPIYSLVKHRVKKDTFVYHLYEGRGRLVSADDLTDVLRLFKPDLKIMS